jgi:hypothetical protein
MDSSQLSRRRSQLVELSYELSVILSSELTGEPFHPDYKRDKDGFRLLMQSHVKLERALKRYFKDLSERAYQFVNWEDYNGRIQAEEFIRDLVWDDEVLQLKVIFSDTLGPAFAAGLAGGNFDLGLFSGLTLKDPPALRALRKHGLTLAKGLTRTTKDRIKESLKDSIELGRSSIEAAQALTDVVDDPKRAKLISDTETVKAYSQAKLAVGQEIGAEGKEWFTSGQSNDGCVEVHGQVVPLDQDFDTPFGPLPAPPGHPRCRCLTKLRLKL